MRPCPLCNERKPLNAFGRYRSAPDGRNRICKPCNAEKVREWRRRNPERAKTHKRLPYEKGPRAECPECGQAMCHGSGWGKAPRRCRDCHDKKQREAVSYRDRQIEAWWNEGLSMRDIQDRLGWSKGHIANKIARLRERGFDLPYRRRTNGRTPKAYPTTEQNKAYGKLRRAIERGEIERPGACSLCNAKCRPVGHHEDYSKPLDVVWVCHSCHRKIHARNRDTKTSNIITCESECARPGSGPIGNVAMATLQLGPAHIRGAERTVTGGMS